jgi:epoxyqueuosine reductase
MTQCTQHPTNQRGLACAEVAIQVNHQSGVQGAGQRLAQCQGVRFARQVRLQAVTAIIGGVHNLDHRNLSGNTLNADAAQALRQRIAAWGGELGFDAIAVSGIDLAEAEAGLAAWLAAGFHGEMDYMARHGMKRARPAELVPGTLRVISARMGYWPQAADAHATLADGARAYVSRYALGRDYHKVLRARLQKLAERIAQEVPHGFRVFVDSAPVLEVELASGAGLGWRGKHSLLLDRSAGSWFFLGEIYTDLPLPVDTPVSDHCGRCSACIDACPTGAIVAPYQVDARRCISYLTIELHGPIPEALRPALGNRIYGCDDCQLVCPWNRFARLTAEPDFAPRHSLDEATLVALFGWDAETFALRTAGSPIHRIGFERWSRNLAVALGNAPATPEVLAALRARADDASALVREHVAWALAQHEGRVRP